MNGKDVEKILKSLGWKIYRDDIGDKFMIFKLPDRIASIIYTVRKVRGVQRLGSNVILSTDDFSDACQYICPEDSPYSPLIRLWKALEVCAPELEEDHVRQFSDKAIVWTQEQDLDKGLRDYAALPTDAPGARPLWHLAALAVLRDVAKLKLYQTRFEAGDRLGFVPYIEKGYIDRALALAEGHAS